MCPADKELMIKSRANEVYHGGPCRFGEGQLHCRRAITYFAGLDKNLSKSLVLIEVLGKRGKKLGCRRPAF